MSICLFLPQQGQHYPAAVSEVSRRPTPCCPSSRVSARGTASEPRNWRLYVFTSPSTYIAITYHYNYITLKPLYEGILYLTVRVRFEE